MNYFDGSRGKYLSVLSYLLFGLMGCWIMRQGEDVVLLVLSLTVFGFAAWTVWRHAGGFILTPALLFFLFFTVFTYIGGLGLFFTNGVGVSYGGGERNYIFFAAVHGGILMFSLGIIIASLSLGFSPVSELARFRRTSWQDLNRLPGDYLVIAIFGIVAVSMTLVFIINRGIIPLLTIMEAQGAEDVYAQYWAARAEFSRYGRHAGSYFFQGYFQQFYLIIVPFVTLFIGSRYLHYRKTMLLVLWVIMGLVAGFFLTMSLQRWPLMVFIIMNYVLYMNYEGRIRASHAGVFAVLTLFLFGVLTYIRGVSDLGMVIYWVQDRIIKTNVDVLYSIFEIFPDHFPFFGGQAILLDIRGVLPGPDIGFTRWLYDVLYRVYSNGTAPTIFWGQMYADFGLPGVLAGSLAAGFAIQAVYITFIRGRKDILRLVIYTILTVGAGLLAMANPVSVLFQFGIVTVFLLMTVLNVLRWFLSPGVFAMDRKPMLPPVS